MVDVVLYEPKLTTVKVGAVIASPTTASSVYTQITDSVSGGVTKWMKDVTVSGIKRGVNRIDFIGKDTNSFQNQAFEKMPFEEVKISGTLAYSPVDTDTDIIAVLTGSTGTTVGSGKRYQQSSITARAIGIEFTNGTKVIDLALNNAELTTIGDISQKADSHVEIKFEMVCLIKDFYRWVNDS